MTDQIGDIVSVFAFVTVAMGMLALVLAVLACFKSEDKE